jgi:hypothetical protein
MKSQRKHSTGTLGRIDEHADKCREQVRLLCNNNLLANEFIYEVQGSGKNFDNKKWAIFEKPEQLKDRVQTWLAGV